MSNKNYDPAELYALLQKEQEEKAQKEADAAKDFSNPNFISMKAGKAYEVRLMYWTSNVPNERKVPIIEKTVHAVKQENGEYHEITCPSSDYLLGRSGFRACPVCTELSKLWDEMQKGSATAKVVYDKFKRKFKGYAVVYVVNDPTTPENNGTFKILYINAIVNNFLREEIKGVDKKGIKIEGARPIGFKAFDPSANGKNLLITVTKDGEYNKYTCKFVDPDGNGEIKADHDTLLNAFDELKFDEYYTPFDPEATKKFYEEVFLEKESSPVEDAKEKKEAEAKAEEPKPEAKKEAKKEEPKPEAKVEEDAKDESPVESKSTAPNVDVDDILAGLPS